MKKKCYELKNKTEFYEILFENTKEYKGEYKEIIVLAPKIYELLCRLLESENLSKESRMKICATIAYFILPNDIYPEDVFGPKGYIEDIFLCLVILREIEEEHEIEEILEYWDEDPKILSKLLNEDYEKLKNDFDKILNEVHEYLGLR